MELLHNIALGFSYAVTLQSLSYALLGCLLGTMIGVLPGLGPLATIAMLLPFTYGLDPLAALIMLSGIYYGAQYGGSTTAILVALPGETASVVTILDGYQMARRGRAGVAITTAALGSFFAGCVGVLFLAAFAAPLAKFAIDFGSPEYFSLMVVGLIGAAVMSSASVLKAIGMIVVGVLLGLVGTDVNSGVSRFTLGFAELWEGIDFVVVGMGVFAFAEVIVNLEAKEKRQAFIEVTGSLLPTKDDYKRMIPAFLRGTTLGIAVGVLPGAGPTIASFGSYTMEKRLSRTPERFGKGAIEGVAGPESANNAAAQTAFVPLLTLGIPGSASMALILGAMMIHNIQPGPQVLTNNPTLFWGLIASMWVGNLMLLVLNLPLVGIWVKLLKVPYRALYPAILVFCCIGVYSVSNSVFNVYLTAIFGGLGYLFRKLRCEPAPLMLGFVLGAMMEENFRRSMLISRGDVAIFFTRPISLSLIVIAVGLLLLMVLPAFRQRKSLLSDDQTQ